MTHSLVLQYPYDFIEIALCSNGRIITSVSIHKFQAVSQSIPAIQDLLSTHNLTLRSLDYIGVVNGPGPYNTLRAILTMLNGMHRITKIPLIACNALDLMIQQNPAHHQMILLPAFENYLFYALYVDGQITQGSGSIHDLIKLLQSQKKLFHLYGIAAHKYQDLLLENCSNIIIDKNAPIFSTLDTLAQKSQAIFCDGQTDMQNYLKPLYYEDFLTLNITCL
jgi:tRNA threonylcarbamoyl adenosine modification protein YeaZ